MSASSSSAAPTPTVTNTCDSCRSRKVRCHPLEGPDLAEASALGFENKCRGCFKRSEECTYDYVFKKPGRPFGSKRRKSSLDDFPHVPPPQNFIQPTFTFQPDPSNPFGPATGSIFGTARSTLLGTGTSGAGTPGDPLNAFLNFGTDQSSEAGPSTTSPQRRSSITQQPAPPPIHQIDEIAPWSDICFFISLHMRHQHSLVPLVHKPSFAQDVLQRRDQGDEVFRGLLCSLVAYTICQCPIHTMTALYSRPRLESILRKCQKASRAIQLKWHMTPSLNQIASLVLDHNTALSGTQIDLANCLISEARRMVYTLSLHREKPRDGMDFIEIELGRRIFWETYQTDKTDAMNGIAPLALNDFEGVPPMPLEVDDDYITTSGTSGQPRNQTSYMSGFVANSKIFQVLGQAQLRQRTFAYNFDAGPSPNQLLHWIARAQSTLRRILDELPEDLREDFKTHQFDERMDSHLGVSQANIHISALCVEFALLDFKAQLRPEEDTKAERESMARRAHALLSSVPIEYLASNGESMRGKVLRIVLDLLHMTSTPDTFGEVVWDWWNMYSSVQFFQVIPDLARSSEPSRGSSPTPNVPSGLAGLLGPSPSGRGSI